MDETANPGDAGSVEDATHRKTVWRLSALTREGADWVVALPQTGPAEVCGTQSAEELARWVRGVNESCQRLTERLEAGPLAHVEAQSLGSSGHSAARGRENISRGMAAAGRCRPTPGTKQKDHGFMGLLNLFSTADAEVHRLPTGSMTVDRHGNVVTTTISSGLSGGAAADDCRTRCCCYSANPARRSCRSPSSISSSPACRSPRGKCAAAPSYFFR